MQYDAAYKSGLLVSKKGEMKLNLELCQNNQGIMDPVLHERRLKKPTEVKTEAGRDFSSATGPELFHRSNIFKQPGC